MKIKTASPRNGRPASNNGNGEHASGNGAPAPNGHAKADSGATKAEEPDPAPPISSVQLLVQRQIAIYAGCISDPEDIYEPFEPFDPSEGRVIGLVTDPMARELYSLSILLLNERTQLELPHNAEEALAYDWQEKMLRHQSERIMGSFWDAARSAHLELDVMIPNECLLLRRGWKVVAPYCLDEVIKNILGSFFRQNGGSISIGELAIHIG